MPSNNDARFARLATDPRFRRPKQKAVKAEIDERFKDVLTEEFGKEKGKSRVDKRGRVISSTHGADEMKRFYRLKSPEDEDAPKVDYARGEGALESSGSEDESSDDDSDVDEEELELGGKRKVHDFALSDSESESDEDHLKIDLSEDEEESAFPPEADEDDEEEEEEEGAEPTTRIAAVNLDWDNMRAGDLYTIFNSFLKAPPKKSDRSAPPPPGKLLHVRIYPSEFGKERMALEDEAGPGGGIFKSNPGDKKKKDAKRTQRLQIAKSDDEEDDEEEEEEEEGDEEDDEEEGDSEGEAGSDAEDGEASELESDGLDPVADDLEIISDVASEAGSDDVDMEKLRQYQLERLRYYYAIATFSTVEAAQLVHDELNGTEFERTANVIDLSYVPADMTFSEDDLHDECTKEPKAYKGNDFVTDALRHSKVKLTWDQDDPNRAKITRRALTREEIEEEDFGGLVAASSDDESEEELEDAGDEKKKTKKQKMKERKDKLRALLLADDDETGDIWGKQGSAWQDELADIRGQDKDDADDMEITFKPGLSASGKAEENLTTLEKYQMRMKEKKAKKKEKIELKRSGGDVVDKEDAEDKIAGDDFFGGSDSEDEQPQTKSKIAKRSLSPVDMDDAAGLVEDQANHFNIKDHIASEKAAAKKRKRTRKSKKGERELELGPEGFKPEADSRFSAIYSEPAFALDPTHSKFTDIQANRDMLKKTRELHATKRDPATNGSDEKDLSALVASVKDKMAGHKRKRARKH